MGALGCMPLAPGQLRGGGPRGPHAEGAPLPPGCCLQYRRALPVIFGTQCQVLSTCHVASGWIPHCSVCGKQPHCCCTARYALCVCQQDGCIENGLVYKEGKGKPWSRWSKHQPWRPCGATVPGVELCMAIARWGVARGPRGDRKPGVCVGDPDAELKLCMAGARRASVRRTAW